MVITIANQKGGSGKSSIAINLAIKLLESYNKVLIMDTDPQKSIESFTNIRESEEKQSLGLRHFALTNRTGNITESLKQMLEVYEYIIIDTGGIDSLESRKAMLFADSIIIPTTPSQFDMDVLIGMLGRVIEIKDINEKAIVSILPNKISTNLFLEKELSDFISAINEVKQTLASKDEFYLLHNVIHDRISYKRAISEGLGITEYIDKKAKDEFNAFFDEYMDIIKKARKIA